MPLPSCSAASIAPRTQAKDATLRRRSLVPSGLGVRPARPGRNNGSTAFVLTGPVVASGAGGTAAELLRDISVKIAPITDLDASDMVRSLKTFPLLDGYRGAPKADVGALEEIILRVSTMVDAHPSIAEMDCNPVMVLPHGAVIVDARVRVQESGPPKPLASRPDSGMAG